MKYTIQSSKYVLKNFFYVFPFAIVPALFMSLSTDEVALNYVLERFFDGNLRAWTFKTLFSSISVLNFASWKAIAAGGVGILALVLGCALMMAMLEKHMRIGKRTFNGVFSKLNDNLISTCGYAILLLAIYELWALITAALLFFVSRLTTVVMAYALSVIVFLGMHLVLLYLIGIFYLWLPCMQITGFKAGEALYYSNQLSAPVKWKILLGQLLVMLVAELSICICAWYAVNFLWFTLLTTALYALMIMIFCVRMQIAYFDLDNIDRADLIGYYRR
ncbi:MAG: hypothetical protein IJ514_06795 [Clostridia bacterium]|nr:hypothetical protein [Clostridia bacterium]